MKITSILGYPAKLSFKIEGTIKVFHDKQKLKQNNDHQATTTKDSSRNSEHGK
jgi:hypothetical protein